MFSFRSNNTVVLSTKRNFPLLLTLCWCLLGSAFFLPANPTVSDFSSAIATADSSNGNGKNNMLSVNGYTFSGEYLVITYTIRYPGMTKVKMFDGTRQLLWRNQYVNDQEGEHKLFLRREHLGSGNYLFEFDYKNEKQTMNVSI